MGVLTSMQSPGLCESDVVATILLATLAIVLAVRLLAYTKLRGFPGPWWAGFTEWPHSRAFMQLNLHKFYQNISDEHGPIARISPNVLLTSSPELWTHVNSKPGYKRSDWFYKAVRVEHRRDNVFSQTDNSKHDARRKQMGPGYSGRENLEIESAIDERMHELLGLIRSKYISSTHYGVTMDLAEKIQFFTLDVISSVGWGTSFGMLQKDQDIEDYVKFTEEGLTISAYMYGLGLSYLAQAPIIGRYIAPGHNDKNGFGKLMNSVFQRVDERAAKSVDDRSDMLASFIRHGIKGADLRSEALEQLIAGSDTTAGSIRGILLHVLTNPRVYGKLQQEIDDAVRNGLAPSAESGLIVSAAQAKKLPYLQAVVREGMRIWPSVAIPAPRDVPDSGDTVSIGGQDMFLPGGTSIAYSSWAMHRSVDVYGRDANVFRPERWIDSEPGALANMIKTSDLLFGYGKWQCLGKPVAQYELVKVVFELLRYFDLAIVDPTTPWKSTCAMGLFLISDMDVVVTDRRGH